MDYLSQFEELKAQKLNLDLTRGKPAEDQLDLSSSLESLKVDEYGSDGIDIRNYGQLKGLSECRELGSMILGCNKEYIWAGGNSSLTLMSQFLTYLCIQGNGDGPWSAEERASILCPVPGYDRHFILSENLGLNMIPVPLGGSGPKLDVVRSYVESDSSIRGIWCVPKHSNPSGEVYSDENLSKMFQIGSNFSEKFLFLFDHAYLVHDFLPTPEQKPLWQIATEQKVQDQTVITTSFSKISFGGGGISFMATAGHSLEHIKRVRTTMIICPDKLNQKRHAEFFKNVDGVKMHMNKHADLIRPKFEIAYSYLEKLSADCGSFSKPTGGYFITYSTAKPIATRVVELCKELGVLITPAGSTFPNNYDPNDSVIRLAPTYVSKDELEDAMEVFTTSIQIAHFDIKV